MDPIGTITRYYPFVDNESVHVLESVVSKSKDLRDFVHNLADEVIHQNQSSDLIFLAVLFASQTGETDIKYKISEKHGNEILIKPWIIPSWTPTESGLESGVNQIAEVVEVAINTNPEDWILLHLHIMKAHSFVAVPDGAEALLAARNLITKYQELECFEADVEFFEAVILRNEDDKPGAYELCQIALKKAREFGDTLQEIKILIALAGWEVEKDFHKAMDIINKAYALTKILGLPRMRIEVLNQMSGIAQTIGEYDLAIKCLIEILECSSPVPSRPSHALLDLASLYCEIKDGKQAMEWAKSWDEVGEKAGPAGLPAHGCPYWVKARAYLLLERYDEALEQIDILHDVALRSGWEPWLSSYYYTSGLYEIAIGNHEAGVESIERALESCERGKRQVGINHCLLALTKNEIERFVLDENAIDPNDSGPWMTRLEREAREKNLHGILMQHSLLKAEFQERIEQFEAARETLHNAMEICDLPSVSTQRDWILNRLEKLTEIMSR
ncbi:MAG: tetratricopeptide repeat protein [Candidatus Thorarchaeota archaeon]